MKSIFWQKQYAHLPRIDYQRIYLEGYSYYREYIYDENPDLAKQKQAYFEHALRILDSSEERFEGVGYPYNKSFTCTHCPGFVRMVQTMHIIEERIALQKLMDELE